MVAVEALKWLFLASIFIVTMVFGLLPIKVLQMLESQASADRAQKYIALLTNFAGGVFLGVCILDMLPEALENFEELKAETGYKGEYPWVLLMAGFGFFFIFIADRISHMMCGGHGHTHDVASAISSARASVESKMSMDFKSEAGLVDGVSNGDTVSIGREGYIKSITFVVAFLLHASLEGFALGITKGNLDVASLFVGIILHKSVEAFSIGTRLVENHPTKRLFVTIMVGLVGLVAVLGGVVGMVLQDTTMNVVTKSSITTLMLCLSTGTFLYITFFEMLGSEHATLGQRVAALVGFVIIALTCIFEA